MTSFGICLIPRFVSLTTGGMENIIVATAPGTFPNPKKSTAGIRYTNAGMVCIKSRIGLKTLLTVLFFAAHIPSGIPIKSAINAELITSASVCMVSGQRFMVSTKKSPISVNIPTPLPATNHPNAPKMAIINNGGGN